jgi:hypothetical protein
MKEIGLMNYFLGLEVNLLERILSYWFCTLKIYFSQMERILL